VAIDFEQLKMKLMYVENVILECCIADEPILHSPLMDHQGRRRIHIK